MAYIDNQTIVVDAILTSKGRELLAQNGNLNITSFALADDEIDYSLYNPNHPNGSAFFDIALRNIPVFEPLSDETQTMKYKLVTLNLRSSIILPKYSYFIVGPLSILTFSKYLSRKSFSYFP